MYLAHLPVQFQILLWLGDESWSGPAKFSAYLFGTIAVLLPSYHFLVRPTWIGWLLNGRMYPIMRRNVRNSLPEPALVVPVIEETSVDADRDSPVPIATTVM